MINAARCRRRGYRFACSVIVVERSNRTRTLMHSSQCSVPFISVVGAGLAAAQQLVPSAVHLKHRSARRSLLSTAFTSTGANRSSVATTTSCRLCCAAKCCAVRFVSPSCSLMLTLGAPRKKVGHELGHVPTALT